MSKGRRLITVAGIVLAVAFSVRLGQARQDDPAPSVVTPPANDGQGSSVPALEPEGAAPPSLSAENLPPPSSLEPLEEKPAGAIKKDAAQDGSSQDKPVPPAGSKLKGPSKKKKNVSPPPKPDPLPAEADSGVATPKEENPPKADALPALTPIRDSETPERPAPLLDDKEIHGASVKDDPLSDVVNRPEADAPRDEEVMRIQAPGAGGETSPLQGAKDASGRSGPVGGVEPSGGEGYVLPADKMPVGVQSVGLSIQVLSPSAMNLHKQARVTIIVKNNGSTDAMGVVVRDKLPEGLKFVSSQPEAVPAGDVISWNLGTITAGSERKIFLNVDPVQVGNYDHGATVFMKTGARAKTVVMQPKLKVEQTASKVKVLKGQQVRFDITVTNVGDGPARGVVVQAKLSSGLVVPGEGQVVALSFDEVLKKDALKPHESITLSPLIADTVAGGLQSCEVDVSSADIADDNVEAHAKSSVEVTEPQLKMALKGSQWRFTNTVAQYTITVENPGTAPAQEVRIAAALQGDGIPVSPLPKGAAWDSSGRRIRWLIPTLEPKSQPVELTFQVRLGGVGMFQVNAEAISRSLKQHATCSTSVKGNADLTLAVTESLRILDIGQETVFQIRVKNRGTKEATKILVHAAFSNQLVPLETSTLNTVGQSEEQAKLDTTKNELFFPVIERLAPGADMTLEMKVKARAIGVGNCHVYLTHDDLEGGKLEGVATTKVTGPPSQP